MLDLIFDIFSSGIIYLVLFLVLFILSLFESSKGTLKLRFIFNFFAVLFLILLIGFRWETGTDWGAYKLLFDDLNSNSLLNVYHFDIGYVLFNALIKFFTDSYTVFLLINSFITIWLLYSLLKKWSPYPNLSLFIFYSAFFLAQFMGSNRRMMAMVFLLWAMYYWIEEKKKLFILALLISFLFHRSAIIGLVIVFIPKDILSLKRTLIYLLISFTVGVFQLPFKIISALGVFVSAYINHPLINAILFYADSGEDHLATSSGSLLIQTLLAVSKRSLFLIIYIYILRKYKVDRLTGYIFNIYIFGFATYMMFIGSFFQMVTAYFSLIEIILVSRMYSYANSKVKIGLLTFFLFYGFIQMLSALGVYPELYMPYISIFDNISR